MNYDQWFKVNNTVLILLTCRLRLAKCWGNSKNFFFGSHTDKSLTWFQTPHKELMWNKEKIKKMNTRKRESKRKEVNANLLASTERTVNNRKQQQQQFDFVSVHFKAMNHLRNQVNVVSIKHVFASFQHLHIHSHVWDTHAWANF